MMGFNLSLNEALEIQSRQAAHYGSLYPGGESALREALASMTRVEGEDLSVKRSIFDVNERVPRGGDIEHLCGIDFSGS